MSFIEYQKELLMKEVVMVQERIKDYDNLSFKIKGWCITLWSAFIVLGFQLNIQGTIIIIYSTSINLIFWMLDTFFKLYQRVWITRMQDIQDFINSTDYYEGKGLKQQLNNKPINEFYVFDLLGEISTSKKPEYKDKKKENTNFWKAFLVRNVWVVYYGLIGTGGYIGAYLLFTNTDLIFLIFMISFPIAWFLIGLKAYLILGKKDFHF